MGAPTFLTEYALEGKRDQQGVNLNTAFVMAVPDEAPFLSAGTFHHVELQVVYHAVIMNLRKVIAFFENNCYHKLGKSTEEYCSWCCRWRDRAALVGWPCLFVSGRSSSTETFFPWNPFSCGIPFLKDVLFL